MIGATPLPTGFRFAEPVDGATVLVNDGPADPAACWYPGAELDAPALWSRQVLTDGRLRAVALAEPVDGDVTARFHAVHATAERVAAALGVGAVEVAVCWWPGPPTVAVRRPPGWSVSGFGGSDTVVVTDARLDRGALEAGVAGWPPGPAGVLLLASCAGTHTPSRAELAAELACLHRDLGGSAEGET